MRISALVVGALLAAGCSRAANKKLDELADRACACTDAECGRKVMADFFAWAKENPDARGDKEAAEQSVKRMQECVTRLAAKGGAAKPAAGNGPAADKPAAEKPAADKPAADKPAADKPAAGK